MGTDIAMSTRRDLDAVRLPSQDVGMVFISQLKERWRLATMLVRSGMIPQKTNEAAMAVMLKAHELGIAPMQGFANIYFFDGKMGISADLMTALFIQRAGGRMTVEEWTNKVCTIRFQREGWESSVVSYTEEDAKEAGLLGKANWKNRKAMLSARCRAIGMRLLAPEVFAGTYTREEIDDMEPGGFRAGRTAGGASTQNAEILGPPPADRVVEAEWEPGDDLPSPEPEISDAPAMPADTFNPDEARRIYFAMLNDRGMKGEADRRALQRRLHADGKVSSASVTAWTMEDFSAAITAIGEIPVAEVAPDDEEG